MDLAKELAHLAKADRDIAVGVAGIARMRRQMESLRANRRPTAAVENAIRLFEETLGTRLFRRNKIARVIANAPEEKPRQLTR
jgi:hypothetical protein